MLIILALISFGISISHFSSLSSTMTVQFTIHINNIVNYCQTICFCNSESVKKEMAGESRPCCFLLSYYGANHLRALPLKCTCLFCLIVGMFRQPCTDVQLMDTLQKLRLILTSLELITLPEYLYPFLNLDLVVNDKNYHTFITLAIKIDCSGNLLLD